MDADTANDDKLHLLLKCFFVAFAFFLIYSRTWVCDDALITLRYADNFLHGQGLVYNLGERVEGFTHPLWLAIVVLLRFLSFPPLLSLIVPGYLFSFLFLYWAFFKIRINPARGGFLDFNFGLFLLIGASAFRDWATGGLETSLSFFLLALYAKSLIEARWQRHGYSTGLISALLVLNRPDFIVFLVFMLALYLIRLRGSKGGMQELLKFLFFPLLLIGGYQLFRMGYYASLLPNPFYAKLGHAAWYKQGFFYLLDFLLGSPLSLAAVLVLGMLFFRRRQPQPPTPMLLIVPALAHGFFVVRGGGDFMHGRFLLPAALLLVFSLHGFPAGLMAKKSGKTRSAAVSIVGLILMVLSLRITPLSNRSEGFLYHEIADERFIYYQNRSIPLTGFLPGANFRLAGLIQPGVALQELSRRADIPIRRAVASIGFIGYYAGDKTAIIDILGLTDPVISHLLIRTRSGRVGHEKIAPAGYLFFRKPTFVSPGIFGEISRWSEIAATPFGVLLDLSPATLKGLSMALNPDWLARFIRHIHDACGRYVSDLGPAPEAGTIMREADYLHFLHEHWYPFCPENERLAFGVFYEKYRALIESHAESRLWMRRNEVEIKKLYQRIGGRMTLRKFFANLTYAIGPGRRLVFY